MPWNLGGAPSWFRHVRWTSATDKRNGVHYVGDDVSIVLSAALADDVTYEVRDYFGNIVQTGAVAGAESSFVVTTPPGGWDPGWYRLYVSGPSSNVNFGNAVAVTNFCVIRDDAHFVPMPPGNTVGNSDIANDFVMKGVMGIGTARITIYHAADPTFDPGNGANLAHAIDGIALTNTYWVDPGAPYADAERPRYSWVDFPDGGYDALNWDDNLGRRVGYFMCKDGTVDGSTIWVQVTAGTNPNTVKVIVYSPDAATVAETYDNISYLGSGTHSDANVQTAINGVSARIVFLTEGFSDTLSPMAKGNIGHDRFAGVESVVSTLYPLGCIYYEGPANELRPDKAYLVHMMRLFQAAVKAGNAGAKAIGPCPVGITQIDGFLTLGGATYCDELSFHAYNSQTNGDLNLGRTSFTALAATMASHGLSSMPMWQTESTSIMTPVYGIHHPRRARVPILQTLLMEQFGVPRERNNYWYERSMGYWDVPVWLENGDTSLNPQCVLYRVLAEETWGKPYDSALDFGTLGNAMYLGNVYQNAAGASTVVIQAASYMTGASVTLTIAGTASAITVVDGLGNESVMPQSHNKITIAMTDIPAYIRLPVGASVTVYRINGHSPLGTGASVSTAATTKQIDGVTYSAIADGGYMTWYDTTGISPPSPASPAGVPSTTTLIWANAATIERVIVWCGPVWQLSGPMIDFDVQTYNGATWTTRKTVTKPTPEYFSFGSDAYGQGCFYETYWDEQWIFDVELNSPVSCFGVRLNVREAAYGGEPLPAGSIGQGTAAQSYRIQEIAVTDVNRYAGVT